MLPLRWEVIMKNKNKWDLSALVSLRRLDEWTAVKSQNNDPYLTLWRRRHNNVLCSKSWIRVTQCHQGALWRYGFLSACSCTGCTKLASRLAFRWRIGGRILNIKFTCMNHIVKCLQLRGMHYLTGTDIILVGQRECFGFEHFSEGFMSRTWTVYLVQLMLIWWKLYRPLSVC